MDWGSHQLLVHSRQGAREINGRRKIDGKEKQKQWVAGFNINPYRKIRDEHPTLGYTVNTSHGKNTVIFIESVDLISDILRLIFSFYCFS